jgi:hypothetical protein
MKWDKTSAIKAIKQHQGNIVADQQVGIARAGVRVWGAIDYLCKKHGFRWYKV